MSARACPACGCEAPGGAAVHAVVAALALDDLDAAIEAGLLDRCGECAHCTPACRVALAADRSERQRALAARERHRARERRLAARRAARSDARGVAPEVPDAARPALPPAAAAALARAKARAAKPTGA